MNSSQGIGNSGPDPLERVKPVGEPAQPKAANAGATFRALLDSLNAKAQELSEESGTVDRPEDLSEAVDHARDSLRDALGVHDRLLEAFRQARQQDVGDDGGGER